MLVLGLYFYLASGKSIQRFLIIVQLILGCSNAQIDYVRTKILIDLFNFLEAFETVVMLQELLFDVAQAEVATDLGLRVTRFYHLFGSLTVPCYPAPILLR